MELKDVQKIIDAVRERYKAEPKYNIVLSTKADVKFIEKNGSLELSQIIFSNLDDIIIDKDGVFFNSTNSSGWEKLSDEKNFEGFVEQTSETTHLAIIPVDGGALYVDTSPEPNEYPGVDIEFIADGEPKNTLSRPRVLVEKPKGEKLRALIWDNPDSEDYSKEVELED